MKIRVKDLRKIIDEMLYDAYRTKAGKRMGDPTRVEADNTIRAGEEAAKRFGGNIDPFTIDLEPVDQTTNNKSPETPDESINQTYLPSIKKTLKTISNHINSPNFFFNGETKPHWAVNAGFTETWSQGVNNQCNFGYNLYTKGWVFAAYQEDPQTNSWKKIMEYSNSDWKVVADRLEQISFHFVVSAHLPSTTNPLRQQWFNDAILLAEMHSYFLASDGWTKI